MARRKVTYNASGKIIPKRFSAAKIEEAAMEGNIGFCVACGAEHDGVEPDARKYKCDCCGLSLVYGAEEIALMGLTKGMAA